MFSQFNIFEFTDISILKKTVNYKMTLNGSNYSSKVSISVESAKIFISIFCLTFLIQLSRIHLKVHT